MDMKNVTSRFRKGRVEIRPPSVMIFSMILIIARKSFFAMAL
jgi:hypothetical protein